MNLSIAALRTERQWRSATGLDQKRFAKLLVWFEQAYCQTYGKAIEYRQTECPERPPLIHTQTYYFLLYLPSKQDFPMIFWVSPLAWTTQRPNETRTLV